VTPTATATETPFVPPTAVVLQSNLPLPTTVRNCPLPNGWLTYTVLPGDSLYAIARIVGISLEDLITANCLTVHDEITAGENLSVPRLPGIAVATSVPVIPTGNAPAVQGCSAPGVRIIAPTAGQSLTGVFNLVGAAALPSGGSYRVDIRPDSTSIYMAYTHANVSVIGGVLAEINSDFFDDGLHWVRLTVLNKNGTATQSCAIPVIFH